MIRKEIGFLKLTIVVIQLLVILLLAPVTRNFVEQLFGGLWINEVTLVILFLLHAYTYRECSRSRMLKGGHLFGIVAVMFQISIPLYILSTLILSVETYLLLANRWPFKKAPVKQLKKLNILKRSNDEHLLLFQYELKKIGRYKFIQNFSVCRIV